MKFFLLFLFLLPAPSYAYERILVDPRDRQEEERRLDREQFQELIDVLKRHENIHNLNDVLLPNLYERDRKKNHGKDTSPR